jgi:hypothetical protein
MIFMWLVDEYSIMIITDYLQHILQALRHVPVNPVIMDVNLVSAIYINRASTMHVSLPSTCLLNTDIGHFDAL